MALRAVVVAPASQPLARGFEQLDFVPAPLRFNDQNVDDPRRASERLARYLVLIGALPERPSERVKPPDSLWDDDRLLLDLGPRDRIFKAKLLLASRDRTESQAFPRGNLSVTLREPHELLVVRFALLWPGWDLDDAAGLNHVGHQLFALSNRSPSG